MVYLLKYLEKLQINLDPPSPIHTIELMPNNSDLELYQKTLDQMHEGLQIINRDWQYVYLNKAASLHGERDRDSLIGKTMMAAYPGFENTEVFQRLALCMKDRFPLQMENEFVYPNGTKKWFELHIEPHSEGILIRSIDITERKKIQEQFWHSQKLDAIGRMAGNLAHALHNKFNIMMLNCENALNFAKDPEAIASMEIVLNAVDESSHLTKQLLAFSRKQVLDLKVLNLNSILKEYRETLPKLMGDNIQVKFHLEKTLKSILIDSSQCDQVILNLCNNARDAMPMGGVLTIETSTKELDHAYAAANVEVTPGEHVMLAITDTGSGISPEVLPKIFDPFFTTKVRGQGTGLGLSSVHGIVKQCGGHLWIYSEMGQGTTIKIYFPVATAGQTEVLSPLEKAAKTTTKGTETILLLEDDPALREIISSVLQRAGYRVHQAKAPSEAREIFKSEKDRIHILVSDVSLPEVNGPQFSKELIKEKPDLKTMFLSGYTENSFGLSGILNEDYVLIQKPVSRQTLLGVVRGVLDNKIQKGVF